MTASLDLTVDPERADGQGYTGIYCRATLHDVWGSWDIACLDRSSLLDFIRARGDNSAWCEGVVLVMLGHPQEPPEPPTETPAEAFDRRLADSDPSRAYDVIGKIPEGGTGATS